MKQEYKYAAYLGGALLLLALVEYLAPKPVNWAFTLERDDKIPYGTYVLDALLDDAFPGRAIVRSRQTLYELDTDAPAETDLSEANLLILAESFSPDSLDAGVLFRHVAQGGHALVAASFYGGYFADTLKLDIDRRVLPPVPEVLSDSLPVPSYDLTHFTSYDTARTTVLAYDEDRHPILLRTQWGAGFILLSSTPYRFTNYALLREEGALVAARTLSYLPVADLYWTEYYQTGRREAATPLRYILRQPPLRWALYLALAGLLLFMVLESKRKQRAIPVVQPPANTTLEFVRTVSNLFLRTRDHQNIAEKKIHYFLDELRTRYRLDTSQLDESFAERLRHKSGKSEEEVHALLTAIRRVQQREGLSEGELVALSRRIEGFGERKESTMQNLFH